MEPLRARDLTKGRPRKAEPVYPCPKCGTALLNVETVGMGHWRGWCHRCDESRDGGPNAPSV